MFSILAFFFIAAYGPAVLDHCLHVAGLSPNAKVGKDITAANGIGSMIPCILCTK
jgi:hypothetical protein